MVSTATEILATVSMLNCEISIDEVSEKPQKFIVNIEATLKDLLQREDTDKNHQITIDDNGPKVSTRHEPSYVRPLIKCLRSYPWARSNQPVTSPKTFAATTS